jgi:V/A-type H+-transporting ATPase subunit I
MSKYAFLVYHREYKAFLEQLRSLGVVHVKEVRPVSDNEEVQRLNDEVQLLTEQIDYLSSIKDSLSSKEAVSDATTATETTLLQEKPPITTPKEAISNLRETLSKTQSAIAALEKERDSLAVWGDFSYKTIENLHNAGYHIGFYTCPAQRYNKAWETEHNAIIINEVNTLLYFITISHSGEIIEIDADTARLPMKDWQALAKEIEELTSIKQQTEASLAWLAANSLDALKNLRTEKENELLWKGVEIQTEKEVDSKLMFLEGWIPASEEVKTETALGMSGCYFKKTEITDNDAIPIQLKNNRFTTLFEPITKLYSLPNYGEIDPTPLFAPFFMLFFGLCFGDGGYGLLLIVASLLLRSKVSNAVKPIMSLIMLFGVTTLIIGVLTGSFFGCSLVDFPSFAKAKKWFISSDNLMIISLVLGFFHVLYGKCIAAIKIKIQRGLKYSLAAFAWLFVILSLGCVLALPMFHITLPTIVQYILYGIAGLSAAVALLYNMPGKNVFFNLGAGVWNTYNIVSGLVGDVLSYIRLYAIGLTGALLGGVFNSMAIDLTASMNPFIRWMPMLLILLIGHALNIGLSIISSLVHPLRLIYVEYYKNSEFEGGGIQYEPFKMVK